MNQIDKKIKAMILSVGKALLCIHKAGYVHCNVQPDAVGVDEDRDRYTRFRLGEFSRTRKIGSPSAPLMNIENFRLPNGKIHISYYYKPPDYVMEKHPTVTPLIDKWALGVLLYWTVATIKNRLPSYRLIKMMCKKDLDIIMNLSDPGETIKEMGMFHAPCVKLLSENIPLETTLKLLQRLNVNTGVYEGDDVGEGGGDDDESESESDDDGEDDDDDDDDE